MRRYIDYINHGALKYIEMNKWIGPTAKHVGMKLCHPCAAYIWGEGGVTNTIAYHLSLHLLLLKSLMYQLNNLFEAFVSDHGSVCERESKKQV